MWDERNHKPERDEHIYMHAGIKLISAKRMIR